MISLAPNLFYGTTTAVTILVLAKNKSETSIQFIDASSEDFFDKKTNNHEMNDDHIKQIMDMFDSKESIPYIAATVSYQKSIRRAPVSLLRPLAKDTSAAIARALSTFDRAVSDGMAAFTAASSASSKAARSASASFLHALSQNTNIERFETAFELSKPSTTFFSSLCSANIVSTTAVVAFNNHEDVVSQIESNCILCNIFIQLRTGNSNLEVNVMVILIVLFVVDGIEHTPPPL